MKSEVIVPNTDLDLSSEVRDYKSNDTIKEASPISEGFILLSDNRKKQAPSNISTAPCKNTTKTMTVMGALNHTMNSIENYSFHHRNRRLLNEVSDDTKTDTLAPSVQSVLNDDVGDVGSFLRVADDDQLAKQFVNLAVTVDGSGFTTEETSEATSTSTISTVTVSSSSLNTGSSEYVTSVSTPVSSQETITLTQLSTASPTPIATTTTEEVTSETVSGVTQETVPSTTTILEDTSVSMTLESSTPSSTTIITTLSTGTVMQTGSIHTDNPTATNIQSTSPFASVTENTASTLISTTSTSPSDTPTTAATHTATTEFLSTT
ncbi:unnamed protein product, partial [Adineta ricciae]